MDYQVRITEPALADFEDIMAYAWANYLASAEHFGNSLLDHVGLLKSFPFIGARVRARMGVRQLVHHPFCIYYIVRPKQHLIEVLHFWHTSRKPPRH